ncbi:MAG: AAA family ATPase [Methylobacterium mesophilicum]|nr:AAA family ATPase [Methylobacterium mesophilicum]
MRLSRLDLTRYGRFTDFALDFGRKPETTPDFHIIYGPNEAGKTTAFSAFLDLLFGIEARSRYDFLHEYKSMQIGGVLEWEGAAHEFARVKRNQNSLLGPGGQPVAETALQGALGGIGRDGYRTMFSLDDETLEKGGDGILESKGDLGQLLFSASAGLSELGQTLSALQAEADNFYKFRARSGALQAMKAKLAELKDARDGIDTLASHYAQLVAEKETSRTAYEATRAEANALRTRIETIRRLLDALPRKQRLDAIGVELAEIATLLEPPQGWSAELPTLMREEVELRVKEEASSALLARLAHEIDTLAPDQAALDRAEDFRRLMNGASRFVTASDDLPNRRNTLQELERRIGALLAELDRPDEADPSRLVLPAATQDRLRELIDEAGALAQARKSAGDEAKLAAERLDAARAALEAAGGAAADGAVDHVGLKAALDQWRRGDYPAQLRAALRTRENQQVALEDRLAGLAPWSGRGAEMAALAVPSPQRMEEWRARRKELDAEEARHNADAERFETERSRLEAERDADRVAGLIDEAKAAAAREARDTAWVEHRKSLNEASAKAFETALKEDDRLTALKLAQANEAVRAQTLARDLAAAEAGRKRAEDLAERATGKLARLSDEIAEAMPFLPESWPLGEREAWLNRRERALEAWNGLRQAESEVRSTDTESREAEKRLRDALGAAGFEYDSLALDPLLSRVERLIEKSAEMRALVNDRDARARDADTRNRRMAELEAEQACWQAGWTSALDGTWLDAGLMPVAARSILSALDRLAPLLNEREGLADRIAKMDSDRETFGRRVANLSEALEVEAPPGDPMPAYEMIGARVRGAENAVEARTRKEAERVRAVEETRSLSERMTLHERRASEMLRFFGVGALAEVDARLREVERRKALESERQRTEREIVSGLGLPDMAACTAALAEADPIALQTEFGEAEAQFEIEDGRVRELYAAHAKASDRIEAVGGDDAVARIEEQRRTVLLEIEDGALQYLRLKMGIAAADQALRAYRDRHRSSMMERASEAFRTISRGAYARLGTQPEKDAEILIGITADGASKLAQDMSKGTRFQLYLALRVAGYFEFARARSPVPFIADDIMETFDDFRAEEAFRLFAGMAEVGQVIYLTHHRHLCSIAQEVCPSVTIHELPAPTGFAS